MPINEPLTQQIREQARQLLTEERVDLVIGYESGPTGRARPAFIYEPDDVERLIWSDACVHNLVNYLHDKKHSPRRGVDPPRVGIVVKPCDSRSLNVLLAEQQIERGRIFVIGLICDGMRNEAGEQPAHCARCTDRVPVLYDVLLGESASRRVSESASRRVSESASRRVSELASEYDDLARVEEMSYSERMAFWLREFDRCIRCYACRQACPGCYCTTCMFERDDGLWVSMGIELEEKYVFHLGRALHLAGRCAECNECERVCPMGLPLSLLNRRLVREVDALYHHRAGRDKTLSPLLFELGEDGSPI